jgi:4-hydroxybenzoate polyprenyltransferase
MRTVRPARSQRPGRSGTGRLAVGLIGASHPEPCAAVTAIAVALAASTGRPAPGLAAVGAAVLAGQLSVGWHNDWLDAARDLAAGRPDKPVATGRVARRTVRSAALWAAAATVPLSMLSGWQAGTVHVGAVAVAWAYNARLKATVWSFVPYAVSFPLLVAFVTLGGPGHRWPPTWALASAALLGVGAHLANAAPDLDDDRSAGVRGLPQRLGARSSVSAAATLLLGASLILAVASGPVGSGQVAGLGAASALVAAGLAARRRPGSRMLFRAAMGVALVDVALLVSRGSTL